MMNLLLLSGEALQQLLDQQSWEQSCLALGASLETARAFDANALAYAQTTLWPNSEVVAAARRAALRRLKQGESMPMDAEVLHREDRLMAMVRLIGG